MVGAVSALKLTQRRFIRGNIRRPELSKTSFAQLAERVTGVISSNKLSGVPISVPRSTPEVSVQKFSESLSNKASTAATLVKESLLGRATQSPETIRYEFNRSVNRLRHSESSLNMVMENAKNPNNLTVLIFDIGSSSKAFLEEDGIQVTLKSNQFLREQLLNLIEQKFQGVPPQELIKWRAEGDGLTCIVHERVARAIMPHLQEIKRKIEKESPLRFIPVHSSQWEQHKVGVERLSNGELNFNTIYAENLAKKRPELFGGYAFAVDEQYAGSEQHMQSVEEQVGNLKQSKQAYGEISFRDGVFTTLLAKPVVHSPEAIKAYEKWVIFMKEHVSSKSEKIIEAWMTTGINKDKATAFIEQTQKSFAINTPMSEPDYLSFVHDYAKFLHENPEIRRFLAFGSNLSTRTLDTFDTRTHRADDAGSAESTQASFRLKHEIKAKRQSLFNQLVPSLEAEFKQQASRICTQGSFQHGELTRHCLAMVKDLVLVEGMNPVEARGMIANSLSSVATQNQAQKSLFKDAVSWARHFAMGIQKTTAEAIDIMRTPPTGGVPALTFALIR